MACAAADSAEDAANSSAIDVSKGRAATVSVPASADSPEAVATAWVIAVRSPSASAAWFKMTDAVIEVISPPVFSTVVTARSTRNDESIWAATTFPSLSSVTSPAPRIPWASSNVLVSTLEETLVRSWVPLASVTGVNASETVVEFVQSTVAFTATRALPGPTTASTSERIRASVSSSSSAVRSRSLLADWLAASGPARTLPRWSVTVTCSEVSPSTALATREVMAATWVEVIVPREEMSTEADALMSSPENRSSSGMTRCTSALSTVSIWVRDISISCASPR